MTSKQKTGLVLIAIGIYLAIVNFYPQFAQLVRHYLAVPLILIFIGIYLIANKR